MTHRTAAARTTTNALCEGDGCTYRAATGEGHRLLAVRGRRLCPVCREAFAVRLRRLPGLYEECGAVLGGGTPQLPGNRHGSGSLPGMPFNGAAADVRTSILTTLSSWCGLVAEGRGLSAPRRSVLPLSAFLVRHADWLAAHPAVPEATREVALLVRRARRIAHEEPRRTVRVGPCATQGCRGELTAVVNASAAVTASEIRCDENAEHVWERHQWTELSRAIAQVPKAAAAERPAAARWLTAADVCRLWGTPKGTVYRLASEQRWRREQRLGRTYYFEQDVHESFRRRAARTL
ncbi:MULTISPECIES: helix-turn-helix domain-containing protein [Streptomyces]|uniref:helix-turn-helix domain-containing protein n=1 Tax=Streptomyces sp. SYP-A7185 TaxID=3040076 RepID=UPI0038F63924